MTKGRITLPRTVVAGHGPIFITLGGSQAYDLSGRDDKGEGGVSREWLNGIVIRANDLPVAG
jgi:hypothetical protein